MLYKRIIKMQGEHFTFFFFFRITNICKKQVPNRICKDENARHLILRKYKNKKRICVH